MSAAKIIQNNCLRPILILFHHMTSDKTASTGHRELHARSTTLFISDSCLSMLRTKAS